jgi:dipeptidyl aminopeptidase/acylaminoacyl peptidase
MGDDVKLERSTLSPAGRWLLVVTTAKSYDEGRAGRMPMYVTESGYEESEEERTRVGRNDPAPQTLWLVDLKTRTREKLAYAPLPGITDDMLASVRAENERAAGARTPAPTKSDSTATAKRDSKERSLEVSAIAFNPQGSEALVRFTANDNKDRWFATVDFARHALRPEHRLTDSAWVNWDYNNAGWLPDGKRFWFLSEESGWSHLYLKAPGSPAAALTRGKFEVTLPALAPDGRWLYALTNAEAPYAYDVYRVPVPGGAGAPGGAGSGIPERLTRLQGVNAFALSPDGSKLWVQHSSTHTPVQLAVASSAGGAARELTDTRTAEYKAIRWPEPRIVAVPSSHGAGPIWSRLYLPADTTRLHPIVMFVHGAGYLQNTQLQFPYYFREQMFHHLLNEHGYIVLDMDYRASQGYGRDWRTAIYRRMGTPELEDLIDGVRWLAREHHGDERKVGVYGGSYGGFMALMAMFKAPDVFKAGAALRPVTDWTQYNHGYTAGDPQHAAGGQPRLRALVTHRVRERLEGCAAHLPRHDRRQRAVRGFGAALPAADRAAQGRRDAGAVPDGAPRLRACRQLARRVQAHPRPVRAHAAVAGALPGRSSPSHDAAVRLAPARTVGYPTGCRANHWHALAPACSLRGRIETSTTPHAVPTEANMRRFTLLAGLLALALPIAAHAQEGASAAQPVFSAMAKETKKFSITAIDKPSRVVTLKNAKGDTMSIVCGDEVKNFAQLKVGDEVKTTYTESVTLHLEGAGEAEATSETHTSQAKPGEMPSAGIMERATSKAKITAIDKVKGTATLQTANGEHFTVTADDKANLDKVQVGNTVVLTVTVSHAIAVTKPTAAKPAAKTKG